MQWPLTVCDPQRRELNMEEEWDRLPYIRVRPSAQAKLQPFDISLASNNTQTIVSFNEYLRITKEGNLSYIG